MAVRDKYQSLIDLASQSGVSNLQVSEEGDVLHVTGTAPSADAKQKVWDEYSRLDPDMRSGDLVLNLEVAGGGEETYTIRSGDTLSKAGVSGVTVEVKGGEVTLKGDVPKAKWPDAMKAANESGAKKVNNQLNEKK